MNNIFDIKRFGNYLLYDLKRAYSNYYLSGLICACLPVLVFLFVEIFSFLVSGHPTDVTVNMHAASAAFAAMLAVVLSFPVKMYGNLTDKRFGSDWLMIPASGLEKFISMILMSCIIVPAVIAALFLCCDGLVSLFFHQYYGDSLLANMSTLSGKLLEESNGMLDVNIGGLVFMEWCESMLIFTLGAICFKKSKVAKTILTLIIAGWAIGALAAAVVSSGIIDLDSLLDKANFGTVEKVENAFRVLNAMIVAWYSLVFAALLGGISYRIKTLKH